jgi:hypothetical protein
LLQYRGAGEILMNSDKARKRAEKSFKKEERAQDGRKAMIEYESQARATREKTARLKELRLAKEAEARSTIRLWTSLAPEHGVISSSALVSLKAELVRRVKTRAVDESGLTMKKEVQDALETAIAGFEKRQDAERSSLCALPPVLRGDWEAGLRWPESLSGLLHHYLGFSTALARLSSR